jgi:hypothetical protein
VGSVLHTSATHGRLYVCIQPTRIYLWYIIFAAHVTFSFESSMLACFQYFDYVSAKEACENFARPIENNTGSIEESWGETCGHCKTTRVAR